MNCNTNHSSARKGQAMIGLLVTVAIIIALAGIYLSVKGKNPDGSTSTKTALRRSVDLAEEAGLIQNLNSIQMGIGMYKEDNGGKVPPTFDELKKAVSTNPDFWINPVDKKPLGYDPNTGLMIVTPYEGMSPKIAQMTAPQAAAGGEGSTPSAGAPSSDTPTGGAPGMPNMPAIPNSSADPGAGGESQ